jgi:integrase
MKRTSYQNGSVVRRKRIKGPDVWDLRYTEDNVQRAKRIGTVEKYRTKAAAQKEAGKLLQEINDRLAGVKVSGLCDRYAKEGMPDRHSTSGPYQSHLKRVRSHWGTWRVDDMAKDVMAVERWINEYMTLGTPDRIIPDRMAKGKLIPGKIVKGQPPRPASKKTKMHIKAFVYRLFECGMKWGIISMQRNPIGLVEVKGKRQRKRPLILLTGEQYRNLIADPELSQHVRVMIQVAMILGLRASEFLGLRWDDVDFERRTVTIRRSFVDQYEDDTKTLESEAELPMHDDLAIVLKGWREQNKDDEGNDISVNGWLFGSITTGRPFWRGTLQQDHLAPAGERVGIEDLGWHAFRHTYRAMMGELEIPLEMQKTLMRHADISTTLSYGGKTSTNKSRPYNAQVVEMLKRRA